MTSASRLEAFIASLTPLQRDAFLVEVVQAHVAEQQAANATDYTTEDGIVRFVREVLFVEPTPYQERILRALVKYKRVCVRSPHGAGKTAMAAMVVLWGMYAFNTDVKIPTTASAWRQLELYLWPEIRKWAKKANLDNQLRVLHLSLALPQKEAFAVASDNPALIEGAHASTLIYVFDEAKAIPNGTWEAAEGAFSGAGGDTGNRAYALAISTPGETSGVFYDIQIGRPGFDDWHAEHISLEECIAAGRISTEWAEQRRKQWGEQSTVYKNRVLGEFSTDAIDTLIPLRWIELANERWVLANGKGVGPVSWGCDPARMGLDQTTLCRMVGNVVEKILYFSQQDTMKTVQAIVAAVDKTTPVAIDSGGLGAGIFDRCRELGLNVIGVNASEAARNDYEKRDKSDQVAFLNMRSYLWWNLRARLDPDGDDPIALPIDDKLTGDLCAPSWWLNSSGKIQIESKDDLREKLGRSSDSADGVALAVYAARKGWSMSDLARWGSNEIEVTRLSADLIKCMVDSGVDVEHLNDQAIMP